MSNNIYFDIGKRLKETREGLGLSQTHVANYLGINRVQLSYFETGKREIDMDTLIKLADLYGCSRSYFIEGNENETPAAVSFRTQGIDEKDLETIAFVQRFAKNLDSLNSVLGGKY